VADKEINMEPLGADCLRCRFYTANPQDRFYRCYEEGCPVYEARKDGTYQAPTSMTIGKYTITRCNANQEPDIAGNFFLLSDGEHTRFLVRYYWRWALVTEILSGSNGEELLEIALAGQ